MFVPTSQFRLYGHVTSRARYGDAEDGRDDNDYDNEDDEEEKEVNVENDAPQLTVICRAARDVRFYLVSVFLILVLTAFSHQHHLFHRTRAVRAAGRLFFLIVD